jgi:hypothetical protein
MVDARYLQCPFCGRLFHAWHQVGAASAMCPCCAAEVSLDGRAVRPTARPRLRRWVADMLGAVTAWGA